MNKVMLIRILPRCKRGTHPDKPSFLHHSCQYARALPTCMLKKRLHFEVHSPFESNKSCYGTVMQNHFSIFNNVVRQRLVWGLGLREISTFASPLLHDGYEWKDPQTEEEVVNIVYITKDGERVPIRGKIGDNAMYLAQRYGLEVEGACEASLACTTCHVYVNDEFFDKLEPAEEKEEDLLDMAPFLKTNSRLGCQIILSKELEGMEISLPAATRNFYVDGHKPQPH